MDLISSTLAVAQHLHRHAPPLGGDEADLRAALEVTRRALAAAHARIAELEVAATHDPLTGLPNRRGLLEFAPPRIRSSRAAVLVLDLDGFKPVNDTWGHAAGDEVLVVVGRRMAACLGSDVARIGGDEFAAVLTAPTVAAAGSDWSLPIAQRLAWTLCAPMPVGGRTCQLTVSIGLAPADGAADVVELLRRADDAMYWAKGTGQTVVTWDQFRADHPDPADGWPQPHTCDSGLLLAAALAADAPAVAADGTDATRRQPRHNPLFLDYITARRTTRQQVH